MRHFEILRRACAVYTIFFLKILKSCANGGSQQGGGGDTLFLRSDTDITYPFKEKIGVCSEFLGVGYSVQIVGMS